MSSSQKATWMKLVGKELKIAYLAIVPFSHVFVVISLSVMLIRSSVDVHILHFDNGRIMNTKLVEIVLLVGSEWNKVDISNLKLWGHVDVLKTDFL